MPSKINSLIKAAVSEGQSWLSHCCLMLFSDQSDRQKRSRGDATGSRWAVNYASAWTFWHVLNEMDGVTWPTRRNQFQPRSATFSETGWKQRSFVLCVWVLCFNLIKYSQSHILSFCNSSQENTDFCLKPIQMSPCQKSICQRPCIVKRCWFYFPDVWGGTSVFIKCSEFNASSDPSTAFV